MKYYGKIAIASLNAIPVVPEIGKEVKVYNILFKLPDLKRLGRLNFKKVDENTKCIGVIISCPELQPMGTVCDISGSVVKIKGKSYILKNRGLLPIKILSGHEEGDIIKVKFPIMLTPNNTNKKRSLIQKIFTKRSVTINLECDQISSGYNIGSFGRVLERIHIDEHLYL